MSRAITTYPIKAAQMKEELAFFAQYFQHLGHEYCEVLFGFAWGSEYYPTSEWNRVRIPLASLEDEVQRVEVAGLGELGSDDLFVSVPPLDVEFRFDNDSALHISFAEPGEVAEFFYQRWKSSGFTPAEWQLTEDGAPSKRLRAD